MHVSDEKETRTSLEADPVCRGQGMRAAAGIFNAARDRANDSFRPMDALRGYDCR